MQELRRSILVTGHLEDELVDKIAAHHDVEVLPFIRIEPIVNDAIKKELDDLCSRELHIVFTSNNGVHSVADLIGDKPANWKCFSIEGVTSKSVTEHFGEGALTATALYGDDLATEILKDGDVKEVVFFCGDLRRDELPERLRAKGVQVKELIVYNTVATPVSLNKEFDAIMFFSPSAVYSYASQNTISENTVCFAIGNTTANTIKNIVNNKILIAQPPLKERVVDMLIDHYRQENK